mmetsp:Transcript_10028/g.30840  ORF Transcript_10028/g.30840 Transcript_10028/m.30840 type:complete len:224 (-) Transcript_10028:1098-1769(-)
MNRHRAEQVKVVRIPQEDVGVLGTRRGCRTGDVAAIVGDAHALELVAVAVEFVCLGPQCVRLQHQLRRWAHDQHSCGQITGCLLYQKGWSERILGVFQLVGGTLSNRSWRCTHVHGLVGKTQCGHLRGNSVHIVSWLKFVVQMILNPSIRRCHLGEAIPEGIGRLEGTQHFFSASRHIELPLIRRRAESTAHQIVAVHLRTSQLKPAGAGLLDAGEQPSTLVQ